MLVKRTSFQTVGLCAAGALALGLTTAGAVADEMSASYEWVGALDNCADCWSLSTGVVALERGIDDDVNVILVEPGTFNGNTPATFGNVSDDIPIVNVKDLNFDTEVGAAFTVGRAFGRHWSVEVSGLQVEHEDEISIGMGFPNPFTDAISIPFDDSFKGPANDNTFLAGVSGASRARVAYKSQLSDLQLTGRHRVTDWFSLLFGLRYTQLNEQINLDAVDDSGVTGQTSYHVQATNHMVGPQVGVALGSPRLWDHLSFGFTGKVSPMLNLNSQEQELSEGATIAFNLSTPNGFLRDTHDSETDFAYVGEVAADVTVHANDWVQFNFGYTAMFLNGVATAPGNFDFSTATPEGEKFVRSSANLLYFGGTGMARVTFKLP